MIVKDMNMTLGELGPCERKTPECAAVTFRGAKALHQTQIRCMMALPVQEAGNLQPELLRFSGFWVFRKRRPGMKGKYPSKRNRNERGLGGSAMLLAALLLLAGCGGTDSQMAASSLEETALSAVEAGDDAAESAAAEEDKAEEAARTGEDAGQEQAGDAPEVPVEASEAEAGASAEDQQIASDEAQQQEEAADTTTQADRDPAIEALVEAKLAEMTLEQKIAQMFVIVPEALTGSGTVTAIDEMTRDALSYMPVGGICYMQPNLTSALQTQEMLRAYEQYSQETIGLPMLSFVDEEGGDITRISGNPGFPEIPWIPSMQSIGAEGNVNTAYETGAQIGTYLAELGFTCDFAPVADVLSNPYNEIVQTRSFGSDPQLVSVMAMALADGLESKGILPVYKHFPGHGATAGDTHAGYAYTDKTLEELMDCELIPFRNAITHGAQFIMISHISLPNVTGDDLPASLSPYIMKDLLRGQLGFDGIIITDAMNMGAIVDTYGFAPAAETAIEAGADMVLLTGYLEDTRSTVMQAIADGRIPEEQIDASVRRILRVKYEVQRERYGIQEQTSLEEMQTEG